MSPIVLLLRQLNQCGEHRPDVKTLPGAEHGSRPVPGLQRWARPALLHQHRQCFGPVRSMLPHIPENKQTKALGLTHLIELTLRRYPQIGVDSPFQSLDYSVGIHECSVPVLLLCSGDHSCTVTLPLFSIQPSIYTLAFTTGRTVQSCQLQLWLPVSRQELGSPS